MVKDRYDTSTDDFLLRYDINNIETEWSAPTSFPDLRQCKAIAVDLETRDPNLTRKGPGWATKDGYIVGIAVAAGDFHGYFPIRHENGPNLDRKMVLKWLQVQLDTPNILKVFHNAPYDVGWLWAEGVEVKGRIIDTGIAAPLIDENRMTYRLDALGKDYLGMRKDEKILRKAAAEWGVDPKAEMWKLPARFVGGYAEQDAVLTLKLWNHFTTELDKQDLWSIFDLESRVLPAVIEMRKRGVRVDLDRAEQSRKFLRSRAKDLKAFIKGKTGVDVEPWAAESVRTVFEALNLPYPTTDTGQPSFTKDLLKDHPHEVARAINSLRETDKADSTFIDSILEFEHNGRIHCEMHQLRGDDGGTVTGRFSSSNPNLQQIPARDPEVRKLIRGIFVPEEGDRWGSFDYSSQEPRMLTHFAASLPGRMRDPVVDTFVQGYQDGDFDFHQMVADLTGLKRKEAKTCIAEGQLVLTHKGLVPIEKITLDHLVWDGVEWVEHEGLVYQGIKEVITHDGLTATPDHVVWVGERRAVPFGSAASGLEKLLRTGAGERPIRILDLGVSGDPKTWEAHLRKRALRLWQRGLEGARQLEARSKQTMSFLRNGVQAPQGWELVGDVPGNAVLAEAGGRYLSAVQQPEGPELSKLWWAGNKVLFFLGSRAGRVLVYSASTGAVDGVRHRPRRQRGGLHHGEYSPSDEVTKSLKQARVYDIKNAGPRHRFTVSGKLVHNCGLGITYGMGKNKLADQLGVSLERASEILTTLDQKVPFVKALAEVASRQAERNGQIRTVLGRLCRFDMWEPRSFGYKKPLKYEEAVREYGTIGQGIRRAFTYKALNRLIQGSAADQTKLAFAQCFEAGIQPMLQVHDELCFSVSSDAQSNEIIEIMEGGLDLKVPSKVDVALVKDWGEVD
jgi:DNA polymerase I-like protein with 3'-5' exonuclease and polymerase domains